MNQGMVTFESLSDNKSLVQLNIAYEPEGMMETVGGETGSNVAKKDLENLRHTRKAWSRDGAWRAR
jgi:uncharacterized membrane protein